MNVHANNASWLPNTPDDKAVFSGWVAKDYRAQRVRIPDPARFQFKASYGAKQIASRGTALLSLNANTSLNSAWNRSGSAIARGILELTWPRYQLHFQSFPRLRAASQAANGYSPKAQCACR